ncbi:MAG: phosphatase PAP2 family protein, partial [Gemmatimonadaceae bacterium]
GRIRHDERLTDIGLHTGESVVAGELIGYVIKGVAGRSRPYVSDDTNPTDFKFGRGFRKGEDYSSFPSGHAIAAFAAASALASEGSHWWPHQTRYVTPLAYTGATMVALSRLYNNKHWTSDVVLSAAVGIFSGTKLVQYQHAHTRNRLDRLFLSASVVPTGDGRVAVAISPW